MTDIVVKLFGPVRDIVGEEEFHFKVSPDETAATVFEALCARYPDLSRWRPVVRLAVNLEYVQFNHHVSGGDEVCIIPPVSGG